MDNNGEPEPRVGSKRPTAADQFANYQNEYEARAKSSVHDAIRQVEEHNKNYPKLNEQLDKRRSIAQADCCHKKQYREENNIQRCSTSKKITRRKVNRLNEPVIMCCACQKRREIGVRKNGRKKSRAAGVSCTKRRGYCVCALALEKKNSRRRLNSIRHLIGNTCRACRLDLRKALCNDDPTDDGNRKDLSEIYVRERGDSDRNSVDSKNSSKSKFVVTPGSGRSSVSTYRSVGSMNEEPMV